MPPESQPERLARLKSAWGQYAKIHSRPDPITVAVQRLERRVVPSSFKKQYSRDLDEFWQKFKPELASDIKLVLLRQMADKSYSHQISDKKVRRARSKYSRNKRKILNMNGAKCAVCGKAASHRHHIIQIQNGGSNSKLNLMPLCKPCHRKIHPWMRD